MIAYKSVVPLFERTPVLILFLYLSRITGEMMTTIKTRSKKTSTPIDTVPSNDGPSKSGRSIDLLRLEVGELNEEIAVLKKRRMEMLAASEENPLTTVSQQPHPSTEEIVPVESNSMSQVSTITSNDSSSVPVEAMVTLLKQIRSDTKPLPRFRGDVLEWPAFIEEYETTTFDQKISDSVNRDRLDKALAGEARLIVHAKLKSTCFLHIVIDQLRRRYGGKDNIIKAAIARVEKVQRLNTNLSRINKFVLDALSIQWMTQQCKVDGLEATLLIKMLDLTPSLIRLKWGDYQREIDKDESGNFEDFVNLLKRVEREANMDDFEPENYERVSRRSDNYTERYHPYEYKEDKNRVRRYHFRVDRESSRTPPRVMHTRRDTVHPSRSTDRSNSREYHRQGDNQSRRSSGDETRSPDHKSGNHHDKSVHRVMTVQADNQGQGESRCLNRCEEMHGVLDCPKFNKLKHMERNDFLKKHRVCLYCAGKHMVKECPMIRGKMV